MNPPTPGTQEALAQAVRRLETALENERGYSAKLRAYAEKARDQITWYRNALAQAQKRMGDLSSGIDSATTRMRTLEAARARAVAESASARTALEQEGRLLALRQENDKLRALLRGEKEQMRAMIESMLARWSQGEPALPGLPKLKEALAPLLAACEVRRVSSEAPPQGLEGPSGP